MSDHAAAAPDVAPVASHDAVHDVHDESHIHVYETSGIAEGNARVPRWLLAVVITLFGFFAYYVATQWSAQPSTARVRS